MATAQKKVRRLLLSMRGSLLVQAPHQRLAHPCHAQHTEALAFQFVQDYARRVINKVLTTVKRRGRGDSMRGYTAQVPQVIPPSNLLTPRPGQESLQ